MMKTKKFIAPQGWFEMQYPANWNDFSEEEGVFLFYDAEHWTGNFRISAYRDEHNAQPDFGQQYVEKALAHDGASKRQLTPELTAAYFVCLFEEEGIWYVSHSWIAGLKDVGFECSFVCKQDADFQIAEEIISSLKVHDKGWKYSGELISIRRSEMFDIDEGYQWVEKTIKTQFKKDFQGVEEDLHKLQMLVDSGTIGVKQKEAWLAIGYAICAILEAEADGLEWLTLIDGNREAPVLRYTNNGYIIDPMTLVWSKVKRGLAVNIIDTYQQILESLS